MIFNWKYYIPSANSGNVSEHISGQILRTELDLAVNKTMGRMFSVILSSHSTGLLLWHSCHPSPDDPGDSQRCVISSDTQYEFLPDDLRCHMTDSELSTLQLSRQFSLHQHWRKSRISPLLSECYKTKESLKVTKNNPSCLIFTPNFVHNFSSFWSIGCSIFHLRVKKLKKCLNFQIPLYLT